MNNNIESKKCPFCSGAVPIPKQQSFGMGMAFEVNMVVGNCLKDNCIFWNADNCKILQVIDLIGTKAAIDLSNQIVENTVSPN